MIKLSFQTVYPTTLIPFKEQIMTAQASRLVAQGLQKSFKKRQVVKDFSLEIESGEVVGLLGPNGAGKSTSFYMRVGLVRRGGC